MRWIKTKEDGAPGHGYNNQSWPPSPNEIHAEMDRVGRLFGVLFKKQAGHKPSHNALDQAVWYILEVAVRKRAPEFKERVSKEELLSHLWKVIQEEFENLDPETIDDCFWAVRAAANETIAAAGWATGKQKHVGVRKAKAAWLASKGFKRIPHAPTVRRYEEDGTVIEPTDGFDDHDTGGRVGAALAGVTTEGLLNDEEDLDDDE